MGLPLVRNIAQWSTAAGSPFRGVTVLGGEVSLHPEATEIVKIFASARTPAGPPLAVRMVTNGFLRTRMWLLGDDELTDIFQIGGINVSLEHIDPKVNNEIRGPGAHHDAMEMAKLL
jgi:pyruvate-formate lyase-activating enzyme